MPFDAPLMTDFLARSHESDLLSDREKQLVGLAVTLTRGCQVCTRRRIEQARASGLDDRVLNALVEVVAALNAGVSAATAREGFRLADAEACGEVCGTRP